MIETKTETWDVELRVKSGVWSRLASFNTFDEAGSMAEEYTKRFTNTHKSRIVHVTTIVKRKVVQ